MRPVAVAVALVVLAAGAACGGDAGDDAGAAGAGDRERTTIRVQVSGEPEETAVYELVGRAFTQENPDVRVDVVEVPRKGDHLAKLTTAFAGGEPPDVFLVNYREYAQFVTRDAVEPMGPHLGRAGVDVDDYYPQPFRAFTYDGVLQCVPQNVSSLVVYYNKVLLQRAGLPPPPPGWSWEEFRRYAKAMTGGGIHGLGLEANVVRVAPFVWGAGGELVDDPDRPSRFALDGPEARRALAFLLGLVRDDKVVPSEEELAAQRLEERFAAGKLAMLLSSRREVPGFREVAGLDWDVAPLPVGDRPAGILHSDGYCVSRSGDDVDAAVRFVAFAAGLPGQTLAAVSGRTVPSMRSVAEGPFLDPTRLPEHDRVFLDGIPHIRATPVLSTWPEIEDVAAEVLTRAFYERTYSVDRLVDELDRRTRDLFEEGLADLR